MRCALVTLVVLGACRDTPGVGDVKDDTPTDDTVDTDVTADTGDTASDDTDVAPIADMEKLGELSIKAGEDHPLTMQVRPLEGDAPKQPTVIHDGEHHLWIADLALTGRVKDAKETKAIRFGLVVVGMSEDA